MFADKLHWGDVPKYYFKFGGNISVQIASLGVFKLDKDGISTTALKSNVIAVICWFAFRVNILIYMYISEHVLQFHTP